MRRLVVLGLALLTFLVCSVAEAAWNSDWPKSVKIGLNTGADGLSLSSGVESVPVLIRLHTGNFQFVDAKPDGTDLRFIAADDKTPLKFHIEKFDGLNELALIWVQVPRLAAGAKDGFIWLYYGNAAAAPADDVKGTYDAAQSLVYHFGEKDGLPKDATANANDATRSTAKANAAGLIGGAISMDGSSEIGIPATPSLKQTGNGLTLSMWFKPAAAADGSLYAQDGTAGLRLNLVGGKLVAQVGAIATPASGTVAVGEWQHVAVVVKDGITLYLNGAEVAKVAGKVGDLAAAAVVGKGFKGDIDELTLSNVARPLDWIVTAARSQGPEQKLVTYGPAEGGGEAAGPSYLKILLGAVTLDGWVVIGVLAVMFLISVAVMASKAVFISRTDAANRRFKPQFPKMVAALSAASGDDPEAGKRAAAQFQRSSLHHIYQAGISELQERFAAYKAAGREPVLSAQSIGAIRATLDARMVRESQALNSKMVLLTIAISGGPFLGLLGTVVGVMITFAAIAAAGDVNVNAIAPGIAAALVATVAGLAVAIPALFGYNYLASRIKELSSDMQVFVDEFITKIAENHSV